MIKAIDAQINTNNVNFTGFATNARKAYIKGVHEYKRNPNKYLMFKNMNNRCFIENNGTFFDKFLVFISTGRWLF